MGMVLTILQTEENVERNEMNEPSLVHVDVKKYYFFVETGAAQQSGTRV